MQLIEETSVPIGALPIAGLTEHLRLGTGFPDDGVQDALLEGFLRAALAAIEGRTGKVLLAREFLFQTDQPPRDGVHLPLPVAPVTAVSEVALVNALGDPLVLSATNWRLVEDQQRPVVRVVSGAFPTLPPRGAIQVRFTAGFGPDWSDLPRDLAQAVLMLAAHYHEFRHDVAYDGGCMPLGVSALIERWKTIRLFRGGRV